jgi:hypothetical protein
MIGNGIEIVKRRERGFVVSFLGNAELLIFVGYNPSKRNIEIASPSDDAATVPWVDSPLAVSAV